MSITRVKPSNWASNEELTPTQLNAVDTNVAKLLDKTVAGDTLSGDIAVSGGKINFSGGAGTKLEFLDGSTLRTESGPQRADVLFDVNSNFSADGYYYGADLNALNMRVNDAKIDGGIIAYQYGMSRYTGHRVEIDDLYMASGGELKFANEIPETGPLFIGEYKTIKRVEHTPPAKHNAFTVEYPEVGSILPSLSISNPIPSIKMDTSSGSMSLWVPISAPHDSYLQNITVTYYNSDEYVVIPSQQPAAKIMQVGAATGIASPISSKSQNSSNVASYVGLQKLTFSYPTYSVLLDKENLFYYLVFVSPSIPSTGTGYCYYMCVDWEVKAKKLEY
jgi:hypothetical protein